MSSHGGPNSAADGADTPVWLATQPLAKPGDDGFLTEKYATKREVVAW